MKYYLFILTLLLPIFCHAQTEGQSTEEYMEFQRIADTPTSRKIQLRKGEVIQYPSPDSRRLEKGEVVGFTDSTISVVPHKERGNGNAIYDVNLEKVPFIKLRKKRLRNAGIVLLSVFLIGNIIAAVLIVGFSGFEWSVFFLFLLLNPLNYLLIVLGLIFLICCMRKIRKGEWKRKRGIRQIFRIKG